MNRSALALCAALLGACSASVSSGGRTPAARALAATLRDARGAAVGTATLTQEQGFVRLVVEAQGLAPGLHGIHVHARGLCTPPDFASAGGHFNPANRQHGMGNPAGPHAGDFPNLEAGADGRARYDAVSAHLTLNGPGGLVADSAAIVIHAQRDDQVTDPAGNAGARIACGVLGSATARRTAP
jgi:Cu-Zn family superoxide dismutase